MKKIKCEVCGKRIVPRAEDRYVTCDKASGLLALAKQEVCFNTFDCPRCGSQIRVGTVLPVCGADVIKWKRFGSGETNEDVKNRPCIYRGKDGMCEDGFADEELSGIETGMENENN